MNVAGDRMTKLLLRWVLLAFSVFAASLVTQSFGLGFKADVSTGESVLKLMVGVLILSFLNATLGKILKLLTLPLSCLTLGLFSLVVNAIVLWVAATLELGFEIADDGIKGFMAAFVASLLISFINGVLGVFLPDDRDD
jgi:putative membrane protein